MTRYADPGRCPDCGNAIAHRPVRCEACGLLLQGLLAQRLFQTLSAADDLLLQLRASALPAPAPVATPSTAPGPEPAADPAARARSGLSAASVPRILLGLGAACVLVAALVFLAVAWSVMGVGGRTVTLVVLTVVTGAIGLGTARRGLRAAAEALVLVSLGLLALDVVGADNAGWLGDLDVERLLIVLGLVLTAGGAGAALAGRRTAAGVLVGAQAVAGLGLTLAGFGLSDVDHAASDADLLAAVVLTALAAEVFRRLRLEVGAAVAAVAGGLLWLLLLGAGLVRVVTHATLPELWAGLHAWPALAAAALAGTVAGLRWLPVGARAFGASVGTAVLVGTVLAPLLVDTDITVATLAVLAALVPAGLTAWFAPRPWGLVAAVTQAVAGMWLLVIGVLLAAPAAERLVDVAEGTGAPTDTIAVAIPAGAPEPWLLPLCVVAMLATVVAVCQASPRFDAVAAGAADLRLVVVTVALSVLLTLTLVGVPVWGLVALPLTVGAALVARWLTRGSLVTLAVGAGFLALGVALGLYAAALTVMALSVVLFAAGLVHLVATRPGLAATAGVLVAVAVGSLTWVVGDLASAAPARTALAGLLLLALLGTTTQLLPVRWWAVGDVGQARLGLEAGAAATAVPLALAGALLAPSDVQATWTAVYLTVAGVSVSATALTRPDRRPLGWSGGLLLAAATWVRLADLGVREPEAYTLPSAVALLLVGLWQLRRREDAPTVRTLGPGLTLALVPSLLWSLAEPTGLRVLLLGLACLALVLAGLRLRWTAPVVWGAVTGGLLVLRLAAPYIGDAVPRWVLIGASGALLIVAGVTWEQRLHEARKLRSYVRGLR